MGDKATLAKARMELEDMYQGIPDESVNLTFQDFAELNLHRITSEKKKKPNPVLLAPIFELKHTTQASSPSPLTKLPSLDFNRALEASNHHQNHRVDHTGSYGGHVDHHLDHYQMNDHHDMPQGHHASRGGHSGRYSGFDSHQNQNHQMHHSHDGHGDSNNHHMSMASSGPACGGGGMRHGLETAAVGAYDHDISGVSGVSMASMYQQERGGGGGRRRPGIPHSNICTICSTYIYIFRHRCLCCGRVYCRQCVMVGMGEMAEGRKCVECLGKRFSQRYIQRAGKVGCWSRYPLAVKQAELKWAEKGPRRTGGSVAYGHSMMKSPRSRTPVTPMTPRTPTGAHTTSSPNSFVVSASYSPYSSHHRHQLPF